MIQVENRRPTNSITLESTRQGIEMCQRHFSANSKQGSTFRHLFTAPVSSAFRFTRRVLSLLLSALIISIFQQRRKAPHPRQIKEQAQSYTIEPVQEEQELQLATQLEDRFITTASHELKTPMTTISGQTQLLLRRLSRTKELSSEMATIRTALESIDGQTRRLNAVVNELLELSSIRAGTIDLHCELCDMVAICRQIIEQESFFRDRTIALIVPATPILLQADCTRLNNLIINLVDNALKYSPPASHVEVYLSRNANSALVKVRDFGSGIPEEEQTHLFEPFYRGPRVQTSPLSGMGLGLTICKEIVDRHHGQIWCESQEDSGSTFSVELPLHQS